MKKKRHNKREEEEDCHKQRKGIMIKIRDFCFCFARAQQDNSFLLVAALKVDNKNNEIRKTFVVVLFLLLTLWD